MALGAAALPLHLVPWVEFNVGRLDEELLVALLELLLQRGRVDARQRVTIQRDQLSRNLKDDRKIIKISHVIITPVSASQSSVINSAGI
jgi:hypothetical protein